MHELLQDGAMRLLIAGGGTGGHLFPGVAIAEELRARDASDATAIVFVGTARGIEARVIPELGPRLGATLELIDVSGLKTVGAWGAVKGLFRVPGSLWQSRKLLKRVKPDVVVGVGGYASGPVVLMARLRGIPTAILEQNSIPGLTNKILGKVVRTVFLAFDETRTFFKAKKIVMSGNPIRRDILAALTASAAPAGGAAPEPARPPHLFVFGGSQGAKAVNELVAEALTILARRGVAFTVVHQTGTADLEATQRRYADAGIAADCRAFIEQMAEEYRRADLIVARSGATTVAELGVVAKPAILIPYPSAADNHQEINAGELVTAGGARMLRQQGLRAEQLADELAALLGDPAARARMGSVMKALGKPRAAATIVDWCETQTSNKKR
jgi:UDP-N-acetylglucosamine--N-acetylmuramyl-(pentapeptide) pyrophosphoryl-undecaprenol N-acetylglucosamine transferase